MNIKELANKIEELYFDEKFAMKDSAEYFSSMYNRKVDKKEVVDNMETDIADSGVKPDQAVKLAKLFGVVYDKLTKDGKSKTDAKEVETEIRSKAKSIKA